MNGVPPVTIVCVFNSPTVREECLDRSIDRLRHEMEAVQYLPIDNTEQQFATAGAALNHGAAQAVHDVVVFVHQDVYLHSLTALGHLAEAMRDGTIGIAGAVGITADGEIVGRMRDRVVMIGTSAGRPVDVDSLDEVLFAIPTEQIRAEPLAESPDLAWHAYAVEYGLRMRSKGLRTVAMDVPLTHNSMTTNLARLAEAHAEVASRYPAALPVRTTCGIVRSARAEPSRTRPLQSHRWRYRWARDSVTAWQMRAAAVDGPVVLSDIRLDVDMLFQDVDGEVSVVSIDPTGALGDYRTDALRLHRGDREVGFGVTDRAGAARLVRELRDPAALLLTNVAPDDLRELRSALNGRERLVGYHPGLGSWVLVGRTTDSRRNLWERQGSVPLLMRGA